jgi:hypothetical protein
MEYRKQPSLREVKHLFTTWRASRKPKTRIPDELWEAAASLAAQYSIHQISRDLRLNYTALKDQVAARTKESDIATAPQACFLELPPPQSPPLSQCLIEMENRHGEKMRMHFSGKVSLDLLAVSQNFWTRRS